MKHIISIDIGSALTKVVEVLAHKGGYELLTLESFPTPFTNEQINDVLLFERLEKSIPLPRLKNSTIAISVPASVTAFAFLDLPKLPPSELFQVIEREARRKIFPIPQEKDIIRETILSEAKIKDEIQEHRLIGAASREVILKYVSIFTKREIIPSYVGSASLALIQNNLETQLGTSQNLAFIDIGHKHTNMAVFKKNEVALIRSIPFACFNFIEAISKKQKISYREAEQLFLKEEVKGEDVADSWDYLLAELRRSFIYYKDITGGSRIDGMIFSGGMMTFKNSAEYIRHSIGGNLEVFEIKSSRAFTVGQFTPADLITRGPLFATAFGLLCALKPQKVAPINFIPSEILREVKSKRLNFLSINVLLSVMVILILVNIGIGINSVLMRTRLAKLKSSFSEKDFSEVMEKSAVIEGLVGQLEQDKRIVKEVSLNEPPLVDIFTLLSEAVSPVTYINEITIDYMDADSKKQFQPQGPNSSIFSMPKMEGQNLTPSLSQNSGKEKGAFISVKIRGNIVSDYETAREELARFYKKLLDSGIFSTLDYEKLKVEEIVIGVNGQNQPLTNVKPREFILEGRIKIK